MAHLNNAKGEKVLLEFPISIKLKRENVGTKSGVIYFC